MNRLVTMYLVKIGSSKMTAGDYTDDNYCTIE